MTPLLTPTPSRDLPISAAPPALPDEEDRLAALGRYEDCGATAGDTLNRVVNLAATLFRVPIALVSLVGRDRQCFVGRVGIAAEGTPRSMSFCAHAIAADEIFTVPDAAADPRFADNPLVRGEPRIRFYAGAPLLSPLGHRLGTLCIIDRNTRGLLTFAEKSLLTQLAALATSHLEDRRIDHENPGRRSAEIPQDLAPVQIDGERQALTRRTVAS